MADTAGDIRSVIKNATQGGLVNKGGLDLKKGAGATGKGNTIATKDEIATQKTDNALNPKPTTTTQTATPTTNKSPISMVADSVNANTVKNTTPQVSTNKGAIIPSTQQNVGIFENSTVQPIENIKVFSGHDINLKRAKKQEPKKNLLIETEGERSKRMGDGVYNLYTDAYKRAQNGGTVTIDEILSNKDYQKEFNGIDQSVLQQLVDDANLLAESEYDAGNVLQLMQKYNNLGLKLDAEKLPSKTKAQLFDEMASGEGGLWELVDWGTSLPFHLAELGISNTIGDENAGKVKKHINDFRGWMQDQKVDVLSKDELANYTKDSIAKLDKEYEKYYHNETEEIFTDRKVGQQFYKDVAKLQKEKGISEKEAVDEVMKNGKYNGVAYEKFSHETTDQGRFWDDKDKEKEYNKRVKDLEDNIRSQHGEDYAAAKNLVLGMAELPFVGYDIVTNLGSFAKNLWSGAKGAGHKAIEGYADLIDTAIATGEDIINGEYNGINYQVGDIREKMAKGKGYENWDDMLNRLGQIAETGDEPGVKLVYSMLQDMSQDRDTAGMMGQYFVDMYGGAVEGDWDKVKENIIENPRDFVSDVATLGELSTGLLKKFGMISPERANEIMKFWGGIDPYEGTINLMNDIQYGPVLKTEKALAKSTAWAFRQPFKMLGNTLEFMMNKLTGISDEERKFIKENPDAVASYVKGEETSQGLLDKIKEKFNQLKDEKKRAGEVYDDLKKGVNRITTDGIFDGVNEKLAEKGIYLVNGKLQFPEIGFTEKQQKQIIQAYDMLKKLQKGEVSASDAWGVRRMIDSTLDWEGNTKQGLDAEAIGLIKDIRRGIDEALKEQVPGFREADANFAQVSNEIRTLEKDWFNKDGTLKDNAYSKIRNLLNKGANEPRLERLERYLPGITKELRALSVSESLEKAGKAMVGQYANQIWGVGGGLTAIMGMLTGGAAVVPMVLGMLGATLATPKNLAALLRWQGAIEKPFKSVISKIENGIKLTAQETQLLAQFLSANREKLSEDAKYMYEKGLITDEEFKAIQEKKAGLKQAMKKIEKDYKAGKISTKEYKEAKAVYREALNNAEYDTALIKARDKAGDEEKLLSRGEAKNVGGKYGAKAENVGFVANIEKDMTAESRKAGTEVRGYADLKNKLYNLSKNPTDTTAQHEFFHAVFSVVDPQTRKYLLNEARKILGGKVGDMAAEEWLAESFGIYAKRGDINAGVLNKVKWGEGVLVNKLRNFFQKNYEWLQNYNGDRATINRMFDEILKDDLKLGENGGLDLSYLLKDNGDNGGVRVKNGLKPKPTKGGNGVMFKKDTGATKYKADINGKSVDIDTKATSPDQLAKVNSEGLSVMKSFISEKQAKKALDVSKELLDDKGNPYLWTHTNKYDDNQFAAFGNVKDSRYKEFTDQGREIAWFSNSEAMSKSYADQESKLANTKSFKNVDELNKYLKDNPKVIKDTWEDLDYTKKSYNTERIFNYDVSPMKGRDGKTYWGLYKTFTDKKIYPDLDTAWAIERNQPFFNTLGDMPASKEEALKALKNKLGDVEIKEKDGKLEISSVYDREYVEGYDTEKEALAEGFAISNPKGKYHYQGIIQDMKKPLVIEANSTWNDIGRADSVAMAEYPNIEKTFKAINDKMADAQRGKKKFDTIWGEKINDKKWELQGEVEKLERGTKERDLAVDKVTELRVARDKINNLFNGIDEKLTPQERAIQINDKGNMGDAYDEAKKIYNEHKDVYDIYNRFASTDETGIRKENILNNDFMDFLRKQEGIDDGIMSLLYNSDINLQDINWFATDITGNPFMNALENKRMSTNDFVFFALRKGGYDGVVFKNISDLGGVVDDATIDGDVVAAFNSKQFKAWDNANPTDSKYISYKKDIRDLTLNNEKKEGAYDPRASLPKPRGGWTKEKITKQIKNPQTASQVGTLAALQAIQEFDSPEDFRAHTFYHGTQGWFAGKPSMSIPEKTFDKMADSFGGGYGQRYWAISLTTDKKIASNFGGASDHVNIYPVILRKNAKVIEMPKLTDSIDLEDHIEQLWNDGVDAVWIGDKNSGEKELAVINPRAIVDLDAPDRYRQYHLGMEDNPLMIKSDADFDRIYENAPKYRQELRDKERAYRGLKDKYFQDNYGETQMRLMDKDYKAYQEAKSKWETSPEKAKYDEGKREYEGLKYNIKNEIKFKKDTSSDGKKLSEGQMEYFKDSKVRDAQGRLTPVYHFTADDFNTVDFKKGSQNLFWFTSDGTASDRAMGVRPGMQRKRKDMYVDIKNPAGWEEYNKFGTDELKYRGYDGVILKNRDGSFEGFIFDKENQVKYTDNLNPTSSKDMRFKKAYHGSPADFDRFDSSHMGEGEGAQAHGWGHYVAVDEKTGRRYAGMGGEPKNEATYKGRTILEHSLEEAKAERGKMAIMGKMDEGKSFEDAKKLVLDEYKGYVKRWKELLKNGNWDKVWWDEEKLQKAIKEGEHIIETAEDAKKSDFKIETRTQRNLYELEIPDPVKRDTPTGSNYFEEDSFVDKKAVDKIVKAVKDSGLEVGEREGNWKGIDKMVDSYNTEKGIHAKNMYHILTVVLGSDKNASKFLESLGYDGIHYYGGRDGEAYVLFNDNAPQIQNHIRYKKDTNGLAKKSNGLQKKENSDIRYKKVLGVIDRDGENPSHNAARNALNRLAKDAEALGFTIREHHKEYMPEEILEYLSDINAQIPKDWDAPTIRKLNITEEDKQRLYGHKNDIIKELLDGIKRGRINGERSWYIHKYYDQKEQRVKFAPTVRIKIGNTEKWYHAPRFTGLAPKRITKYSPRGIKIE